MQHYRF